MLRELFHLTIHLLLECLLFAIDLAWTIGPGVALACAAVWVCKWFQAHWDGPVEPRK